MQVDAVCSDNALSPTRLPSEEPDASEHREGIVAPLKRQELAHRKSKWAAAGTRRLRPRVLSSGDEHIPAHCKAILKDKRIKDLLVNALMSNRFCRKLDEKSIVLISKTMEHYEFAQDEAVVKQGEPGGYFFILGSGRLEVIVNGKVVNSLGPGTAFGGIALLYDCPRTATVVARDGPVGVWGTDSLVFRRVVKEHSQQSLAENRKFLDQMAIFDGLSAQDKARVGDLELMTESLEAGARVFTEGQTADAVYFVKDGTLAYFSGGEQSPTGKHEGGTKRGTLSKGDSFGWRAVGEPHSVTVLTDTPCELVFVSVLQIRKVLGEDFAKSLERSFILSVLRKLPLLSVLGRNMQERLAYNLETRRFGPDESLPKDSRLVVVVDGEAICHFGKKEQLFRRGAWCEDEGLEQLMEGQEVQSPVGRMHMKHRPDDLEPGPNGCRVAMLSPAALHAAVMGDTAEGECPFTGDRDSCLLCLQKVLLLRKVAFFQDLSDEQVSELVGIIESRILSYGSIIFSPGDTLKDFHAVIDGDLEEIKGGSLIRSMRRGNSFGARALLLDERRSSLVKVASEKAKLWVLKRDAFNAIVPHDMRKYMATTMELLATDVSLKLLKHVRLIGAGSFGSVRMVEHKRTGMRYALKRVSKASPDEEASAKQECALLREVAHPFVMRCVKTFESSSSLYILTELITGGQMYEQIHQGLGVLQKRSAQFYMASLVLILESLHEKGIIYRDLKPENVMLDMQGYCKLVDFGLAKRLTAKAPRTFTLVGTMYYMAPEVLTGTGYGVECDFWSLGVFFYELVCGRLPFGHPSSDDQDITDAILGDDIEFPSLYNDYAGRRMIKGLLEKDPANRLGVTGVGGWSDVKANKYFKVQSRRDIFAQIQGRELAAPVKPSCEKYTEHLEEKCTLSDAEILGQDEPEDQGRRVAAAFKKFDLNGDGKIDRDELGIILSKVDPKVFTKDACDALMATMDLDGDGGIVYNEFVHWIFDEKEAADLVLTDHIFQELDVH